MPIKAVQQFMLGTVLNNEQQAKETLAAMKAAGYDGIELCGFMIHPIGFVVKLLTKPPECRWARAAIWTGTSWCRKPV